MIRHLIFLCIIFFLSSSIASAEEEIIPEIKSSDHLLNIYQNEQKAILHLDLGIIYLKNNNWEGLIKHLEQLYSICPWLKEYKVNLGGRSYNPRNNPEDLDEDLLIRLFDLGLIKYNKTDRMIQFLNILRPVCERICQNNDLKNN